MIEMTAGLTFHRCYGLTVGSQIPLPDLGPAVEPPAAGPDVLIRIGPLDPPPSDATVLPLGLWRTADLIGFGVPGTGSYVVRGGREIVADVEPGADASAVRLYLLGTAMGALMMQRGHLVLHGNAFRVGDAAAVVVGRSGAGKSTLAAELQRRGLDVLADDVVPVDAAGRALPGYPRIKLWGDAVERLGVDTAGLERVASSIDKFQLPIRRTSSEPLPLRWVYVLERHTGTDLQVTPASGMETFSLLHEHTYRNELVHGDSRGARAPGALRPARRAGAGEPGDPTCRNHDRGGHRGCHPLRHDRRHRRAGRRRGERMTASDSRRYVRRPGLNAVEMDGELVMMGQDQGEYYGLREVAASIWEHLAEPRTAGELCALVAHEYDVTAAGCHDDVVGFLDELLAKQLVAVA